MSAPPKNMPDIALRFERALAAPADRVFAAVTRAEHLSNWLADEADSDPRVGGRLVLRWRREGASEDPFEGEWIAIDAPSACSFTGGHAGYPNGSAGRVEITVVPEDAGTRLTVRHIMPPDIDYAPVAQAYAGAWPRALDRLTAYLTPGA